MSQAEKKKVQRVKLRIYKNPVKWDASIIEADPKGEWIVVQFDGPRENIKLYRHSETLLADKPPIKEGVHSYSPEGTMIYEVL